MKQVFALTFAGITALLAPASACTATLLGQGTPLFANDVATGGKLLDGGDVDASSVRLAGPRVTWLSGNALRSAILH